MGQNTVLIVEDSPEIRDTLQLLLEDEGYHTLVACDGDEALNLIPKLPRPTIILLDLMMPKIDGYGVLCDLADHPEKRDHHPIFLLTANMAAIPPDMARLLGSEGIPVLPKPFDIDQLLGEISGCFGRMKL